jgi:hypothetical protein
MTVETNKFEVSFDDGTYVFRLNGNDISRAVTGFTVGAMSSDDRPTVSLDLVLDVVEIATLGSPDNEYMVNLPADVRGLLGLLGWTPSADDNVTFKVPKTPESWGSLFSDLFSHPPKRQDVYEDAVSDPEPICTCSPFDRTNMDLGVRGRPHSPMCDAYQSRPV